ncbi:type II toxin-antitoxin system prevent-host-death family antitoxin [Croceicoccus ponticola]|uniref:Type II toxin-antitoxin system prevent-host-death family antitoxin n=1 Tax=Croceicoccus ponticola TaxID=2217664 RepID=A0A437GVY0_9SPHN|nr:type II toxin-antitoxin system prevent-host-death family antitoxin [Croceicoccus ponticola]RVQ66012.1 type II toxin-antitoxin system prevent-host-death family antitoxin [Croceicoccus ponticola]
MNDAPSITATAAEVVRSFSYWRDVASKNPVTITNHGRATHVLVDAAEFQELAQPKRARSGANPGDLIGLSEWIDEALMICGEDLRIEYANRVAGAVCRKPTSELVGRLLTEALPAVSGSLMEVHARRTVIGGEPSAADIPSPFNNGAWLRFQSFPVGTTNVLMFRDITEDVQRHRLADVKAAILAAMVVHGDVGYVRLSVRGTIERSDEPFSRMVQLDAQRLVGITLSDLVMRDHRARFRDLLESVLQGGDPERMQVGFLSNSGSVAHAKLSMVQLHGAYGAEGAIVMLTPCNEGEAMSA